MLKTKIMVTIVNILFKNSKDVLHISNGMPSIEVF